MAMGRRKPERQEPLFVTGDNVPRSQGHPFYKALNRLLAEANFDRWVELDLSYIDRWTLWLDLSILLRTMPNVMMARGR